MTSRMALLSRGCLQGALILLVCIPPLAYGAVSQRAQLLTAMAAFVVLLGISVRSLVYRQSLVGSQIKWPLLILLLWMAWVAAQAYPLPVELIRDFSPERAAQLDAFKKSQGSALSLPGRMPLAADLDRHAIQLLFTFALMAAFIASAWSCRVRSGRWWLLVALLVSGVVQALAGGYEALAGHALSFFGVKSEHYAGMATGSYVNRNHFAGYMQFSLAAAVAILLAFSRAAAGSGDSKGGHLRRWLRALDTPAPLLWASVAILVSGLLLSQSRMGSFAALVSLLSVSLMYQAMRGELKIRAILAAILFALIAASLFHQVEQWQGLADRFESTQLEEESRWRMMPELLRLAGQYMPMGSGLGSFAVVFPQYRELANPFFYDHAHNDYVQFWIEVGAPGLLLLALFVLITAIRACSGLKLAGRSSRAVHLAALIAILAVAIHSATDFNLQIPANALTLMILMGASWGCPTSRQRPSGVGVNRHSDP